MYTVVTNVSTHHTVRTVKLLPLMSSCCSEARPLQLAGSGPVSALYDMSSFASRHHVAVLAFAGMGPAKALRETSSSSSMRSCHSCAGSGPPRPSPARLRRATPPPASQSSHSQRPGEAHGMSKPGEAQLASTGGWPRAALSSRSWSRSQVLLVWDMGGVLAR